MLIFFCDNLIVQGHQNRETYIGCGGSSGGYHFCEDSVGMYNPFSLLNTFCSNKFKDYWFETGTPTLLVPVPLFFQTGYLTIKDYDQEFREYTLGFPNDEVKNGFLRFIYSYYVPVNPAEGNTTTSKLVSASQPRTDELRTGK